MCQVPSVVEQWTVRKQTGARDTESWAWITCLADHGTCWAILWWLPAFKQDLDRYRKLEHIQVEVIFRLSYLQQRCSEKLREEASFASVCPSQALYSWE